MITVSHDRFFLDKMADSIFEVRGNGEILRYNGNWSDWAAGRKEEKAPEKTEKARPQERNRHQKLKFSYKEQREFETIDDDPAELEKKVENCKAAQNHCGSDYLALEDLQKEQAELEKMLEEKMERWMYLTELKEKIDAQ